jgi:DNA-binding FrmR family transcriptional regulator
MSHIIRNKTNLLARVRRIRGQVEALERALEAEKGCSEIMQQIAAFRGAANGLMTEVIEEHVRTHIANPSVTSNASRAKGADELIEIVRAYLR